MKNEIYRIKEKLYDFKHSLRKKYYDYVRERYTLKARKRLKNDNFSILCSNCIGGTIYNRLGKQFLSPTINLWFYQKDFLRFIQNIHYYLSLDLKFIETERNYPVAVLDDIYIFFLHYTTNEEAELAWNRRKKRINFDNLYIIMYDRDGMDEKDYDNFSQLQSKNKIILSDHDNKSYPFILKLTSKSNDDGVFLEKDKCGIRTFERQWDYVDWLNNSI